MYSEKIDKTVKIEASTVDIEERGVKLRLTVVDTPGFGDAINCQSWFVATNLTSRNHKQHSQMLQHGQDSQLHFTPKLAYTNGDFHFSSLGLLYPLFHQISAKFSMRD